MPDLQAALMSEVAEFDPALHGVHHQNRFEPLVVSRLLAGGAYSIEIAPLEYNDIDVGEDERAFRVSE